MKRRRILSLTLAFCLLLALAPAALAEGETNVAQVGEVQYPTLAAAISALRDAEDKRVTLLADLTDTGPVSLPAGATLDGGGHTLTGASSVYISAQGGTVQNVNFQNIHNAGGTQSAVYAESLTGAATVTGCSFDSCDWDTIQITPKAGASISITGNTFRTTADISPKRYIHVETAKDTKPGELAQPAYEVDFAITVQGNRFYDGAKLKGANIEVYYPKLNSEKVKLSGNYMAQRASVCVMTRWQVYAPEFALPLADEGLQNEIYPAVTQFTNSLHLFHETVQQTIEAGVTSLVLEKDVDEDITIPAGKTITLSGNGHTVTGTIVNEGTLQIMEGGPYDLSQITNQGTVTLFGGTYTTEPNPDWVAPGCAVTETEGVYTVSPMNDAAAAAAGCVARNKNKEGAEGVKYYKTLAEGFVENSAMYLIADVNEDVRREGNINVYANGYTYTGSIDTSSAVFVPNGKANIRQVDCTTFNAGENMQNVPATINIEDGNVNEAKVAKNGQLTIHGGTFGKATVNGTGSMTVNDGTFRGDITVAATNGTLTVNGGTFTGMLRIAPKAKVEIRDGCFSGAFVRYGISAPIEPGSLVVSGGYFNSDLSDYVAEGYAVVPSDKAGYAYMVVKKGAEPPALVEPAVGATAVDMDRISTEDRDAVEAVAQSVTAESGVLAMAAKTAAQGVSAQEKADAEAALTAPDSGVTVADGTSLYVYSQVYLSVTPTAYDGDSKTVTLDIVPKSRVVASTADTAADIKVVGETDETPNAVVLPGSEKEVQGIVTIPITVALPNGFAAADETTYYVKHTQGSKLHHYYPLTITEAEGKQTAAFTNLHGFSAFALPVTLTPAASITAGGREAVYESLQAAVDAAREGQVVKVLREDTTGITSDTNRVTVENGTVNDITVDINGEEKQIAPGEQATFVAYTVTFDARGGSMEDPSAVRRHYGDTLAKPKDPTKAGADFGGWYKDEDCTQPWNFETDTVTGDLTLYAQWTPRSEPGTGGDSGWTPQRYTVSVSAVEHGTVAVTPKRAAKNDTVTITVTPDEGYELSDLTVTDRTGSVLKVTAGENGKYTFRMPGSKVEISVKFTETAEGVGTACGGGEDCPAYRFTDVDTGMWYHEGVDYAVAHGLMKGTSETTFDPQVTTSRGMIVTILYRLEGEPATAAPSFDDVAEGEYYTNAVAWAAENHIVNGYGDGSYGPNDPVTREQMAAILYRYAAYKGGDVTARGTLADYADAGQISPYAVDAMAWANAEGLVNGMSATTLAPTGNATRAQVATILTRFCENTAK